MWNFQKMKKGKKRKEKEREGSSTKLEYCIVEILVTDGDLSSSASNRDVHKLAGDVLPCTRYMYEIQEDS